MENLFETFLYLGGAAIGGLLTFKLGVSHKEGLKREEKAIQETVRDIKEVFQFMSNDISAKQGIPSHVAIRGRIVADQPIYWTHRGTNDTAYVYIVIFTYYRDRISSKM